MVRNEVNQVLIDVMKKAICFFFLFQVVVVVILGGGIVSVNFPKENWGRFSQGKPTANKAR